MRRIERKDAEVRVEKDRKERSEHDRTAYPMREVDDRRTTNCINARNYINIYIHTIYIYLYTLYRKASGGGSFFTEKVLKIFRRGKGKDGKRKR